MSNRKISGDHQAEMIRNISIISHVDHGKTTLSDHLIATGGMLPRHLAGTLRALDFLQSEQDRGITIESSLASFHVKSDQDLILVNLIDTPGHVDFSGKVTEALHLVDNGLILIDAVEGIMSQTVTVLHQAIRENLNLILFINKVDRLITELQFDRNQMAQRIERIIGEVYSICKRQNYQGEIPTFSNNRVILGSALDGWAVDFEITDQVGKINGIFSWYETENSWPNIAELTNVFTRIFDQYCLPPCKKQRNKYRFQSTHNQDDELLPILKECSSDNEVVLVAGKRIAIEKTKKVQSVVRVLSGTVKVGMNIHSSMLDQSIIIEKMYIFRGRRLLETDQVTTGHIIGIIFSKIPPIGDILSEQRRLINKDGIKYLQEPVVSISIEPIDFQQYEDLVNELEFLSSVNSGVKMDISQDTGEIILSAIGTLQLDLIVEELEDRDYQIITSNPEIMEYKIPTETSVKTKRTENWTIEVMKQIQDDNNPNSIYIKNGNELILHGTWNEDFVSGLLETFGRLTNSGEIGKIRNLQVILTPSTEPDQPTFEDGMILASKVINFAKDEIQLETHEPCYILNIFTSKQFVGNIVNMIQQNKGEIDQILSENTSQIKAILPIQAMGQLADSLRKASDGNILWNIENTIYRKK